MGDTAPDLTPRVLSLEILYPPQRDRENTVLARAVLRVGPFTFVGVAIATDARERLDVVLPNNRGRSRTVIKNAELRRAIHAAVVERYSSAIGAPADPARRVSLAEEYEDECS